MSGQHDDDSLSPSDSALDSDDFLRAVARAPETEPRSGPSPEENIERLGQFRIVERIGRGGMGIVYRAEDEKLRRTVALKVLPEDFSEDGHRQKRFLREARLAAALAHPNVATIHDVGEADGRIYIAMELVTGTTLRRRLDGGRLPVAEAVRIAKDIARGVAKAHARGIAHRDLKPDNVMVSEDGTVKVLDFGLAKPVEREPSSDDDPENVTVTQEGRIIGTPGYMSPEQATGRAVDVRTDVFSLGVVLYEMVTGTRPFKGETSMDALIATSRDAYVPASKIVPKVPAAIDRVLARCLEKDPALRFATAGALLAALDGLDSTEERPKPKLVYAAVALALVGLVTWRLSASGPSAVAPPPPATVGVRADPVVIPPAVADPPPPSASTVVSAPPPPASAVASAPAPTRTSGTPVAAARADRHPRVAADAGALPTPKSSAEPTTSPGGGVIERSPY